MSRMRDFPKEAASRLVDHQIRSEPAKRWYVSSPHDRSHWYNVVWFPGILHISGDLGELTMTHYQALLNLHEGAKWVADSDLQYLLGKTDAKDNHLDVEATAEYLVEIAVEYRDQHDDDRYWDALYEEFGFFSETKEEILASIQSCDQDLPRVIHEMGVWDDFYGVFSYDFHAIWRVTALKQWATEFGKGQIT